ncbi:hypothetical protein F7725_016741, partial [Dissostichus mawsoni]
MAYRSIHIVALGSECPGGVGPGEEIMGQGQLQGGLLWSYLGHGALVGPCDLESSMHNPALWNVTVVVRDCPSWDLLDSDWPVYGKFLSRQTSWSLNIQSPISWPSSRSETLRPETPPSPETLGCAGHPGCCWSTAKRPPCNLPLCASDWSSCVPHSEGLQLSRDLGATYLELPSLNHVFVGRYFGSVPKRGRRRKRNKVNDLRPPHLEQPARLPPIRVEESSFSQDCSGCWSAVVQFADVAFYAGDSGKELGWATLRERDGGPNSLLSTWDGAIIDDMPRSEAHSTGRLSRLVVKDPPPVMCLWETLMFIYR